MILAQNRLLFFLERVKEKSLLKEIALKKIHKRHQKIPIFFATAGWDFSNSFFAIPLNFYAGPNTFRIFIQVSRSKYQIEQLNNNFGSCSKPAQLCKRANIICIQVLVKKPIWYLCVCNQPSMVLTLFSSSIATYQFGF